MNVGFVSVSVVNWADVGEMAWIWVKLGGLDGFVWIWVIREGLSVSEEQ